MLSTFRDDRAAFESGVQALKTEIANIGVHTAVDASARIMYAKQIRALANDYLARVQSGRITWKQAAFEINESRNIIMEVARNRSTPVGKAIAQSLKSEGRTLNELVARKTASLFGKNTNFTTLSPMKRDKVFAGIVSAAGRSDPKINALMRKLSPVGRGLVFFSVGLSVYTIATSDNITKTAAREVSVNSAGIGGGFVGGAMAGLACGPGAPVCVSIGGFIGGALAAFSIDYFLW